MGRRRPPATRRALTRRSAEPSRMASAFDGLWGRSSVGVTPRRLDAPPPSPRAWSCSSCVTVGRGRLASPALPKARAGARALASRPEGSTPPTGPQAWSSSSCVTVGREHRASPARSKACVGARTFASRPVAFDPSTGPQAWSSSSCVTVGREHLASPTRSKARTFASRPVGSTPSTGPRACARIGSKRLVHCPSAWAPRVR